VKPPPPRISFLNNILLAALNDHPPAKAAAWPSLPLRGFQSHVN